MSQVEGRNSVLEILKYGRVKKLLVAKGLREDAKVLEILELAAKKRIPLELVSKTRLDELSETERHQGIIALVEARKYGSIKEILAKEKQEICLVLLDRVQDPQNLGSILRTAEAAGVDGVVVPEHDSVGLTPAVQRVSMGGSVHVPVARESLFQAVKLLRDEGIRVIGVDPSGPLEYFDERLTGPIAFVLGGEKQGVSSMLLGRCDSVIRVPMMGSITSLNVGVAAALVLYERIRQQRKGLE